MTDMVIKPVGGVALDTQVGLNCDKVLRNQLIFQRGASTARTVCRSSSPRSRRSS